MLNSIIFLKILSLEHKNSITKKQMFFLYILIKLNAH